MFSVIRPMIEMDAKYKRFQLAEQLVNGMLSQNVTHFAIESFSLSLNMFIFNFMWLSRKCFDPLILSLQSLLMSKRCDSIIING